MNWEDEDGYEFTVKEKITYSLHSKWKMIISTLLLIIFFLVGVIICT